LRKNKSAFILLSLEFVKHRSPNEPFDSDIDVWFDADLLSAMLLRKPK